VSGLEHLRVLDAEDALLDGQRPFPQRDRLLRAPRVAVAYGEVATCDQGVAVLRAKHALLDTQRLLPQRDRVLDASRLVVGGGEIPAAGQRLGVLGTDRALHDTHGPLPQRDGVVGPGLRLLVHNAALALTHAPAVEGCGAAYPRRRGGGVRWAQRGRAAASRTRSTPPSASAAGGLRASRSAIDAGRCVFDRSPMRVGGLYTATARRACEWGVIRAGVQPPRLCGRPV
jgi:hypothetical protein